MDTLSSAWPLDHFGHVVRDVNATLDFYSKLCGYQVECRETLSDQAVEVCFLKLPNTLLELIAPLKGNTNLTRFLEKRGEGLHHVCYRVDSTAKELQRLDKLGVKLIDREPRKGSRNLYMGFLHPENCHGVLIELCSEKR